MRVWFGLMALMLAAVPARAAEYPAGRSIRLVVGFAAGGGADLAARVVARRMSEELHASIIVENRGGAGGVVAAAEVAAAKPDGHTLLWGSSGAFALSPAVGVKLPFDPLDDFAPVSRAVTLCNVLVVGGSSPYHTLADLIAAARAAPGKLSYGTPGVGSAGHTSGELFIKLAHVDMVHVPFTGGSEVNTNLMVGDITSGFVTVSTVASLGKDHLRPLAVTSTGRDPLLPDVPSFEEAGVKGYDATFWYGLLAPKATPKAVVDVLNNALRVALTDPAVVKAAKDFGVTAAPDSPDEFADLIVAENRKWKDVMEARR